MSRNIKRSVFTLAVTAGIAVTAAAGPAASALAITTPPGGVIVTVAGEPRYSPDGIAANEAALAFPYGVSGPGVGAGGYEMGGIAVGPDGALYISDRTNNRVRKVTIGPDNTTKTGSIITIAGTGVACSIPSSAPPPPAVMAPCGDGGDATKAQLSQPAGLVVGPDNSVYIADIGTRRVRKVSPNGQITTVAGKTTLTSNAAGDFGPATNAQLRKPMGLALGGDGSLYITDFDSNQVRKVDPGGTITTIAGAGLGGGAQLDNIQAVRAQFDGPSGIAVRGDGTIFIADRNNHRVRAIRPDGVIYTYAGDGSSAAPNQVTEFDPTATTNGNQCTNITAPAGQPAPPPGTSAGTAGATAANDPSMANAAGALVQFVGGCLPGGTASVGAAGAPHGPSRLSRPTGIALAPNGTLYIANREAHMVNAIVPDDVLMAMYKFPSDQQLPKVIDIKGNRLYRSIRVAGARSSPSISGAGRGGPGGGVSGSIAGLCRGPIGGTTCATAIGAFAPGDDLGGGAATSAQLRWPQNVAVDPRDGTLYILDQGNLRVLRVDKPGPPDFPGTISRVAGGSNAIGGGPLAIQLLNPRGVAVGPDGSIYIAESDRSVVRKVNANGDNMQTIAGTGDYGPGCPDEMMATQCPLVLPVGVAVAADGTVYIADRGDHRVRKIRPDGTITTIAGISGIASYQGSPNLSPNGQLGFKEPLNYPSGVAVSPDGMTVYIADTVNDKIRKVDSAGLIWDVAGKGIRGYFGDGGDPMSAELNNPSDVAVGPDGTVYFADQGNDRIRRIKGGIIDSVAGIGDPNATVPTRGSGGDGGPANQAQLNLPDGVGIGPDGSIYIADRGNNKVRRVTPDGKISTVAGTGTAGDSGDNGPAVAATLRGPRSVAVAPDGTVFVADSQTAATSITDTGPGRIRAFRP